MAGSYTILTVFENTETLNEPVISLPLAGKVSFRQIGYIVGLSVMLPLAIYSGMSEHVLGMAPEPVFSFGAVNTEIRVTWDVLLAMAPMPAGLLLGVPRPKLMPMDVLVMVLLRFMMRRTSIRQKARKPGQRAPRPRRTRKASRFAGFAQPYGPDPALPRRRTYSVAVTELGIPKNITVTLYDAQGNPMRNRLARAYVDDVLQCSITTDPDGTLGMTFVPHSEGRKNLRVVVDGTKEPAVDATLEIKKQR